MFPSHWNNTRISGVKRGGEKKRLQPRRRSRPSRIAVTCWTIRPRSPSNRREATVRSRLLHLLPPSNPPRGEEGTRTKRPRSTADTQTLAPQQANADIKDIRGVYVMRAGVSIRLIRVSTPIQVRGWARAHLAYTWAQSGLCKRKMHYEKRVERRETKRSAGRRRYMHRCVL